jgi:hypothetical protein
MRILDRLMLSAVVAGMLSTLPLPSFGQTETATVSGRVTDTQGGVVPGAEIQLVNVDTNIAQSTKTNSEGLYVIPNVHPGHYRILVLKDGFKEVVKTGLVLHVQDIAAENFSLQVGSVSESVTVTANQLTMNTTDGSVSTVVDRQFAENLPLNGRSFQTLIDLTPGVVITASGAYDGGQFSVNGQRANANYWTVDGVSANFGVGTGSIPGNGIGGTLPSFSVLGGTNSLVSVDALEEFRIQTSTYAPEFGRAPGGQISIVTRSGTNQLHGTLFDYFRNDALDANNWFASAQDLPKPEERQNDFGGTLSGPIVKNRTFFFFSYEGLRLRLPQVVETAVPDIESRESATAAVQPYLNAYPLPSLNLADIGDGVAPFNASFSNRASLDAYSLRIDHRFTEKLTLFARYNDSPSSLLLRGPTGESLSVVSPINTNIQTFTVGATWMKSLEISNDLRFNYSRTNGTSSSELDNFGGAVPLRAFPFPSPYTLQDGNFEFGIFSLEGGVLSAGHVQKNLQRQINIVDNLAVQKGSHSLKLGVDFRRLSPVFEPPGYLQLGAFSDVPSAMAGNLEFSEVNAGSAATLLFHNLGAFAQDSWRIRPGLTVTYGIRWDVDFAPSSLNGPSLLAVTNFNDPANLALAPAGTPPFRTRYGNFAPRLGIAYELSSNPRWQTVVRGGFGVFYDLGTGDAGDVLSSSYPFGGENFVLGGTFPLPPAVAAPPPITPGSLATGTLYAFDPHLQLPYTLQWSAAVEQGLGEQQTVTASYIGSAGRRLIQSAYIFAPNVNFGSADLIGNTATSDYDALQLQFQRKLSRGLQVLASYTWSHSIDTASAGSFSNASNTLVPNVSANANRGDSDFDIRNAFSGALTYEIPTPKSNAFARAILGGWSTDNIVLARSALPLTVYDSQFGELFNAYTNIRLDLVPGQPVYFYSSQYPGGKALNPAAFTDPPIDPTTGIPLRQGDLGRNSLRGFGMTQWDFAVHRNFPIREALVLEFRAELFNVLNHPNFANPDPDLSDPYFGRSIQMLGQSLDENPGGGSFNALYQVGGPRSIQLALKLQF